MTRQQGAFFGMVGGLLVLLALWDWSGGGGDTLDLGAVVLGLGFVVYGTREYRRGGNA